MKVPSVDKTVFCPLWFCSSKANSWIPHQISLPLQNHCPVFFNKASVPPVFRREQKISLDGDTDICAPVYFPPALKMQNGDAWESCPLPRSTALVRGGDSSPWPLGTSCSCFQVVGFRHLTGRPQRQTQNPANSWRTVANPWVYNGAEKEPIRPTRSKPTDRSRAPAVRTEGPQMVLSHPGERELLPSPESPDGS